jgi:hypothetical protein
MDISKEILIIQGEVLDVEDQQYSSTHVSGGGVTTVGSGAGAYAIANPIRSVVRHHQNQKIWIKKENGEEAAYSFYNDNVDVRKGNLVTLYQSRKTGRIYRFHNKTTGYYWLITGWNVPTGVGKKIIFNFRQRLSAFINSIFLAMPIISGLAGLSFLISRNKSVDFDLLVKKLRFWKLLFSMLAILSVVLSAEYLTKKQYLTIPTFETTISKEFQARTFNFSLDSLNYIHEKTGVDLFGIQKQQEIARINAEKEIERIKNGGKSLFETRYPEFANSKKSDAEWNKRIERLKSLDRTGSTVEAINLRDKKILLLDGSKKSLLILLIFIHIIMFFVGYKLIRKEQKVSNVINKYLTSLCAN